MPVCFKAESSQSKQTTSDDKSVSVEMTTGGCDDKQPNKSGV